MQYLYSYDPMGRLNGMMETSCLSQTVTQSPCTSNHGPTCGDRGAYGPAGEMTGLTYDGFTESRTYNSLLQLTRMTATGSGQTVMDMQYTFSGTQNNGRITQSTDATISGGETVMYTYDTLNRLTKAETTSAAWGDAYTYDGFGNLDGEDADPRGTAPTMTASYDLSNHQVGQTYDGNGNTGFNGTYPYDVENHLLQPLTSGTSPQWTYDPSGKRVFAKTPGNGTTVATTSEIYFYGVTGQKLGDVQLRVQRRNWRQRAVLVPGKEPERVLRREADAVGRGDGGDGPAGVGAGECEWGADELFPIRGGTDVDGGRTRRNSGTYFRDPAANGGLDYADQRYYANASVEVLDTGSGAPPAMREVGTSMLMCRATR